MPTIQEMTERPLIYDTDPLIEQIKDLQFYFDWLNKAAFQPTQTDWDYYRLHLNRIKPLEDAWRSKRRNHMISQARPFLEWVNPIHAKIAKRLPDVAERIFELLDIYDAACEFYVSLESSPWSDSQALRAEHAIRKLINENNG